MRKTRLIVPAAGAGKRLGVDYPKTLVRVLDRPILDHILTALDALATEAVVVVSPSGEAPVREFLRTLLQNDRSAGNPKGSGRHGRRRGGRAFRFPG